MITTKCEEILGSRAQYMGVLRSLNSDNSTASNLTAALVAGFEDQASAINIGWFLICAFLVLFMKTGFMLLESGSCPKQSQGHLITLKLVDSGVAILSFFIVGYDIAFSQPVGSFIRNVLEDSEDISAYFEVANW
jgi:hypothetical protein